MESSEFTMKRKGVVHWLYNELIQEERINRPYQAADYQQRKASVESAIQELKRFKRYGDKPLFERLKAAVVFDRGLLGLRDEDVAWVNKLPLNELFSIWVWCRNSVAIDTNGNQVKTSDLKCKLRPGGRNISLSSDALHLALHADEQNTMYDLPAEGVPTYGVYGLLNLQRTPTDEDNMRVDVIDFLCSWSSNDHERFDMLERLQRFVSNLRQQDYLSWMREVSSSPNVDWIWRYLRKEHGMPGEFAEPMRNFGKARIYGVFVNWRDDKKSLKDISEKARLAFRRKQNSTKSGKKSRTNLTLDVNIKKKLEKLASESGLHMSEVVEKLVAQATGVGSKYDS